MTFDLWQLAGAFVGGVIAGGYAVFKLFQIMHNNQFPRKDRP